MLWEGLGPFHCKSQKNKKQRSVQSHTKHTVSNALPRKQFPFLYSLHSTGKAKVFLFPAFFIHASIYCWLVSSFHPGLVQAYFPESLLLKMCLYIWYFQWGISVITKKTQSLSSHQMHQLFTLLAVLCLKNIKRVPLNEALNKCRQLRCESLKIHENGIVFEFNYVF